MGSRCPLRLLNTQFIDTFFYFSVNLTLSLLILIYSKRYEYITWRIMGIFFNSYYFFENREEMINRYRTSDYTAWLRDFCFHSEKVGGLFDFDCNYFTFFFFVPNNAVKMWRLARLYDFSLSVCIKTACPMINAILIRSRFRAFAGRS